MLFSICLQHSSNVLSVYLVLLLKEEQGCEAHLILHPFPELGRACHCALRLAEAVVAVHP